MGALLSRPQGIAFQLWIRLSVVMIGFTVVILPFYVWVETVDSIESARREATVRAEVAAASPRDRYPADGLPETLEQYFMPSLGLRTLQTLAADGGVLDSAGELNGPNTQAATDVVRGVEIRDRGVDVRIEDGDFTVEEIHPLDLFRGRKFGVMYTFPVMRGQGPGSQQGTGPANPGTGNANSVETADAVRIVVGVEDLTGEAQALLWRSVALAGGLLFVGLTTIWILLRIFVARPLGEYGERALRIAQGEPLRMPMGADNEIGRLGAAINSMADSLWRQANMDALTGLYNLRHFEVEWPLLLERARRERGAVALLNIDVDNLKPINDSLGHLAGDTVLRGIGEDLRAWAGNAVTCWRTGGDEFAAAMPGTGRAAVEASARMLQERIAARESEFEGALLHVSVSVGFAIFPEDGADATELAALADQRMYEQKTSRRRREAA